MARGGLAAMRSHRVSERGGQCWSGVQGLCGSGTEGGLWGQKLFAQCPFIVPLVKGR